MTNALALPKSGFHLSARNPQEMAAAQADLAIWFQRKQDSLAAEVGELEAAVAEAKLHKWKSSTLQSQLNRARARQQFYGKCLLATQAGFTIIPNIPVDVFAVRVKRETPKFESHSSLSSYGGTEPRVPDTRPEILPPGEGRYVSESPLVVTDEWKEKDAKGEEKTRKIARVVEFGDEIEFPVIAAMPEVMSEAAAAMAFRVFDDIGVSPQRRAKGDPLIIGRIHSRAPGKWSDRSPDKTISYLIAWHLDLRTL